MKPDELKSNCAGVDPATVANPWAHPTPPAFTKQEFGVTLLLISLLLPLLHPPPAFRPTMDDEADYRYISTMDGR
jgi:hypothetical protein